MSQEVSIGDLEYSVGYVLKRAAVALRTAIDAALAPLGLSAAQYACLELLGQCPGQSNAELARGAFVTRQSMNHVLRGLQDCGLVTRADAAPRGRALPTQLTETGRDVLDTAHDAVHDIQRTMVRGMSAANQERLRLDLLACADSLVHHVTDSSR